MKFESPWDLVTTYLEFRDYIERYPFNKENNHFLHITTGSHIQQISMFLLTESRTFPGKLIQTSPPQGDDKRPGHQIIDLDLSKYDAIATRFSEVKDEGEAFLKAGINTLNKDFNFLIQQIEKVASKSKDPMLITGPTGAGKSKIASRIFALKQKRNLVKGQFVETNCATLMGENAMSTLFGHKKGAYTGAQEKRDGLLKRADGGLLFLDEIGDLSLDGQAMLLRAIEDKCFLPLGADIEDHSDFQLIAGTNKDLRIEVSKGTFRADLFSRINTWIYRLPGLSERREDIEPNLEFELARYQNENGKRISFNKEAREKYIDFSLSEKALWTANFRDLSASINRMSTLSEGGRIKIDEVADEINKLSYLWEQDDNEVSSNEVELEEYLESSIIDDLDNIDIVQIKEIIKVCLKCKTGAEAARILFNKSRLKKATQNDSHRMKTVLDRFNISFNSIKIIQENKSTN
jgi:transcriptional regulatory protein RtcR